MDFGHRLVEIACPYCLHVNRQRLSDCSTLPKLMYCNPEDGGCDEPFAFAVDARIEIDVKTAVLRLSPQDVVETQEYAE